MHVNFQQNQVSRSQNCAHQFIYDKGKMYKYTNCILNCQQFAFLYYIKPTDFYFNLFLNWISMVWYGNVLFDIIE